MEKAAPVALRIVLEYLGAQGEDEKGIGLVRFVLFGRQPLSVYSVYRETLSRLVDRL